jgi:hypothetical protein
MLGLTIFSVYSEMKEPLPKISRQNKCSTECLFALGIRVNFENVGEADLILIDGISAKLASALMTAKNKIIAASDTKNENKLKAFEIVKGIGPKKASNINQYLYIN